jgi:UDP-N-acetylglucosamine:LPS N-acetylglucosamine transferase
VRGVTDGESTLTGADNIVDYLTSESMEKVLKGAAIVVARSGFSTVMDLNVLGKKAILVPTPGQTEQEYLANKLMKDNVTFTMNQGNFDLAKALVESEKYTGFTSAGMNETMNRVLTELLSYERM